MTTKALSITVTASALAALILATELAAAEPRFEPNRSQDGLAQFQMNKKVPYVQPASEVVLDYETMQFLEINSWDYDTGKADFQQANIDDVFTAYFSVCQGEGLGSDAAVRDGLSGSINTYCKLGGDFLAKGEAEPTSPIPLHPDWPDGGLYDAPEVVGPAPQTFSWPYGATDY